MTTSILGARDSPNTFHALYLDLEGHNLGRNGRLQMLQIYCPAVSTVWLIYASLLGHVTFNTTGAGTNTRNLKDNLKSNDIIKVFWDCRTDSDVLFAHHGIRLDPAAVVDLQLLELATTVDYKDRKKAKSLATGVHKRIHLPREVEQARTKRKEEGKVSVTDGPDWREKRAKEAVVADALFKAGWSQVKEENAEAKKELKKGTGLLQDGWDAEFAWVKLPLPAMMAHYAANDVVVLPLLHKHLATHPRLTPERKSAVAEETVRRIEASQAEVLEKTSNGAPEGWVAKDWCEEGAEEETETGADEDVRTRSKTRRTKAQNRMRRRVEGRTRRKYPVILVSNRPT